MSSAMKFVYARREDVLPFSTSLGDLLSSQFPSLFPPTALTQHQHRFSSPSFVNFLQKTLVLIPKTAPVFPEIAENATSLDDLISFALSSLFNSWSSKSASTLKGSGMKAVPYYQQFPSHLLTLGFRKINLRKMKENSVSSMQGLLRDLESVAPNTLVNSLKSEDWQQLLSLYYFL